MLLLAVAAAKGQLISGAIFGVFKSPINSISTRVTSLEQLSVAEFSGG